MHTVRRAAPFVYAIAILLAVFLASGKVVGLVAAIGGVLLGALYALGGGRRRSEDRSD